MDERKILLVNLAKGKIGEDAAGLLGALLVAGIGLAALSRSDVPETQRPDSLVYLDEFQSITTLSLATMLSELRKYRVSLVLAHQYLSPLDEPVRDAVLGNIGTLIALRVGAEDAEFLEREFEPPFSALGPRRPAELQHLLAADAGRDGVASVQRGDSQTAPRKRAECGGKILTRIYKSLILQHDTEFHC